MIIKLVCGVPDKAGIAGVSMGSVLIMKLIKGKVDYGADSLF
jgi:hypothetical protein